MSWVYLGIAILFEVIGTSTLAISDGFSKLVPTVGGLTAIGVSFFFVSLALKTIPVGIAYAIWSGSGIVLISFFGFAFLRQSLDAPALAGIGLIIAGVVVINLFSNTTAH